MSTQLVDFLLRNSRGFPQLSTSIQPHLTTITQPYSLHIDATAKEIAAQHPKEYLYVLNCILSDKLVEWPYGIGDTLGTLRKSEMTDDKLLTQLLRKGNAR